MKKVILNKCYGLFSVSPKAYFLYAKKINKELYCYRGNYNSKDGFVYTKESLEDFIKNEPDLLYFYSFVDCGDKVHLPSFNDEVEGHLILDGKHRFDPILIEVIEELGDAASGKYSELRVVEIPDDVAEDYKIDDYDGIEILHKKVTEY